MAVFFRWACTKTSPTSLVQLFKCHFGGVDQPRLPLVSMPLHTCLGCRLHHYDRIN